MHDDENFEFKFSRVKSRLNLVSYFYLQERNYFMKKTMEGVNAGLQECKRQFQWEKWNCDIPVRETSSRFVTLGEYFPLGISFMFTPTLHQSRYNYVLLAFGV